VTPRPIEEAQREGWDDEVALQCILMVRAVPQRLHNAGWHQIIDGVDGLGAWVHRIKRLRLIHSLAREADGAIWSHVSLSRRDRKMPTWEQVRDAGWLIHPDDYGVIVVAPKSQHVDIGEIAHVWYCLDHSAVPDFTKGTASI
jgi:hypothetical protein